MALTATLYLRYIKLIKITVKMTYIGIIEWNLCATIGFKRLLQMKLIIKKMELICQILIKIIKNYRSLSFHER